MNTKNKKAQIQMGENVIILFIFFILLIFAVVFYSKVQSTKTQQAISEDVEGRGLQIAQAVLFLPELQCSKDGVEVGDCYDFASMWALKEAIKSNSAYADFYFDIFSYSTISLQKIYPQESDVIVIYDRKKEDYTSKIPTYSPIILCDFLADSGERVCDFGVLKVEVYN